MPVVVVDDHDLIGDSLVMALRERLPDVDRLAVRSERQLIETMLDRPTGVVILDLELGLDDEGRVIDGATLVEPLRQAGWRIVIVSGSRARAQIGAAVAAGASGYIPKSASLPQLISAVVDAVEGRELMSAAERLHWGELHRRAEATRLRRAELLERLAPREHEILELLTRGHRVGLIASRFVVSESTVRTQVKSILRKLEVNSQIEAVALYRNERRR